jgi:hypothetical protein
MEDRIKAETGHSVTWESGGGFWKTLDGVYPSGVSFVSPSANPLFSLTLSFSMNNSPLPTAVYPLLRAEKEGEKKRQKAG